jgi:hypothetical protein
LNDLQRKERGLVTKGKDTFTGAAGAIKPYLERAMTDDKLRNELMHAFGTARELYGELMQEKGRPITLASRVATDDDIRDKLRDAIDDLRRASERLQGRHERSSGRSSTVLIAGIALGILFNPVTGPETRRFIRDLLSAGGEEGDRGASGSNGRG